MKKKLLIVSDLDGTLLQDDHTVSKFNKDAINKAIEAGHIFCIATGRAWSETKDAYESVGINTLVVTSNGSSVDNPTDESYEGVYSFVGRENANKVLSNEWIKNETISFSAPTRDTVTFFNFKDELLTQLQYKNLKKIHTDKCEVEDEVISLILMVRKDIDLDEFKKQLNIATKEVQHTTWELPQMPDKIFIELNTMKCKEFGVRILADYYGINKADVVTFGDQMNDYTMTKYAGTGYVMKNGHDGLKAVADEVLDKTNMEHGVGHKILELIK